jgi:hypothetical protein
MIRTFQQAGNERDIGQSGNLASRYLAIPGGSEIGRFWPSCFSLGINSPTS